jgi:hypothetical protein
LTIAEMKDACRLIRGAGLARQAMDAGARRSVTRTAERVRQDVRRPSQRRCSTLVRI